MTGGLDLTSVRVAGVAMTNFQRNASTTADDLAAEAAIGAIADSGTAMEDVDAVYVGHVFQGRVAAQRVLRGLGIEARQTINVENACASGATAFALAVQAVATGVAEVALALGYDKLSELGGGVIPPDPHDLEGALGRTNPSTYALLAKRHMAEYGTTPEQLAAVAVKARRLGARHPRAQVRREVTVEEVLNERMIAYPLTRLQCCPTGDGAAAAVVMAADRVKSEQNHRAMKVLASVLRSGTVRPPDDPMINHAVTKITAAEAYSQAGIGPSDIDIVELHDAFSIAELVHMEDLGLCEQGESGELLMKGVTMPDGGIPVNVGGGLMARGHPLGATGLAQLVELVAQLRGESEGLQVDAPRIALAQCEGGVVYGLDAGLCAIHILAT